MIANKLQRGVHSTILHHTICSQEEADTLLLLHVKDAMNCGFKSLMIRTGVLVLAIAHFQDLPNTEHPWIAFGTGKYFRYIPIHDIASGLCH